MGALANVSAYRLVKVKVKRNEVKDAITSKLPVQPTSLALVHQDSGRKRSVNQHRATTVPL